MFKRYIDKDNTYTKPELQIFFFSEHDVVKVAVFPQPPKSLEMLPCNTMLVIPFHVYGTRALGRPCTVVENNVLLWGEVGGVGVG